MRVYEGVKGINCKSVTLAKREREKTLGGEKPYNYIIAPFCLIA